MASFLDKFMDTNKSSKMTVISPRKAFEDVLKQASGSAYTRALKYNIYYQIYAFYGIVDGIGTSTLVANTALGIAEAGLTVCVIDTSILAPVQDVLLNTNEAVLDENSQDTEHFDWFDMPFMKTSPLHVSKKNKNISVLSFKGKRRGVIDFLSTNDSDSLAEIALTTLHNKFDIILIDCCHEMSAVNTACLQQAQQVIQVWNDSPTVLANLENFITNSITLSCALDKMRYVVGNRLSKDAIGSLDDLCKQYRCKLLTTNYLSEELYLLAVTGKTLFRVTSTDDLVIKYTESVIEVICHILNIDLTGKKPKGTISSNEIMNGVVEGTLHKELKDFNDEFSKEHPDILIDTNPIGGHSGEQMQLEEDMAVTEETDLFSSKAVDSVMSEDAPVDENEQREMQAEVDALNYGGVIAEDDVKPEELVDNDGNGVPDIMENPERKKKKSLFGKQKNKGNKK